MITSVLDAIDALGDQWHPDKIGDFNFVVQYDLSDPLPGDISQAHCVFDHGNPTVCEGVHPSPDVTLSMTATDFVKMCNRDFDISRAIQRGALRVKGNMRYAGLLYQKWQFLPNPVCISR